VHVPFTLPAQVVAFGCTAHSGMDSQPSGAAPQEAHEALENAQLVKFIRARSARRALLKTHGVDPGSDAWQKQMAEWEDNYRRRCVVQAPLPCRLCMARIDVEGLPCREVGCCNLQDDLAHIRAASATCPPPGLLGPQGQSQGEGENRGGSGGSLNPGDKTREGGREAEEDRGGEGEGEREMQGNVYVGNRVQPLSAQLSRVCCGLASRWMSVQGWSSCSHSLFLSCSASTRQSLSSECVSL